MTDEIFDKEIVPTAIGALVVLIATLGGCWIFG